MSLEMIWVDYCENGSIHGLRYVIQKERKLWERLMWMLLLIVASITIVILVSASWEKYSYSSMKIVVDDPRYPLAKIDFPAITICPINKIMYSKALDLVLNKYSNDSDMRTRWSNSIQSFGMLRFPHNTELHFFMQNKSTINVPTEDIPNLMLKLRPTIDDIFNRCFWRGIEYKCVDILRFQRTEEGFCYSFNSKTAERNINGNIKFNPPFVGPEGTLIPLRNNAAGKGSGLKVIMNNMSNEFFPNDNRRRGYNVMVHTPEAFPDVSIGYKVHAQQNHIARISVSVAQVKADDSLNRFNQRNDKCFMYNTAVSAGDELFSESVAEDMCYSECRLMSIYMACNCTQYFFKLYKGIGSYCGIQDMPCLIKNDVLQRNPKVPENEPGFPKWSLPASMNCSCPPPCSFIEYTTEIQHDIRQFINMKSVSSSYKVILEVNYRELFATSYLRSMKYSSKDLLVSFGGVASLFLGCSLVSVAEFLYAIYKTILVLKQRYINNETYDANTSADSETPQYTFTY